MFTKYISDIKHALVAAEIAMAKGSNEEAKKYTAFVYHQLNLKNTYHDELSRNKEGAKLLDSAMEKYCDLMVKLYFSETYKLLDRYNTSPIQK